MARQAHDNAPRCLSVDRERGRPESVHEHVAVLYWIVRRLAISSIMDPDTCESYKNVLQSYTIGVESDQDHAPLSLDISQHSRVRRSPGSGISRKHQTCFNDRSKRRQLYCGASLSRRSDLD